MCLLAIDLGTTTLKVSLFDPNLRRIESFHQRIHTKTAPGGIAEQDPTDWLAAITAGLQYLNLHHSAQTNAIEGIAVTGHMMGCLPVDKEGSPLGVHLLHSDTRARAQADRLASQIGADVFYQLTGNILNGASVLPKILWLKEHQPQAYDRSAFFLNAKDFINGFLTGAYNHTDYSDASHAGLLDIQKRAYAAELFQSIHLDQSKMPQLHAGIDPIGRLCPEAARILGLRCGIPVMAGAGDGACSAIGAAAGSAGDVYCCMGTTAWIACLSLLPVFDQKRRTFNIISGDGCSIGTYGTIQNCGRSTDFARAFFGVRDMIECERLASEAPAGSDGLLFLPYLDGERGPVNDPDSQGVFYGLSARHSRAHGLRSVFEGVALALRHNADVHRENHQPIDKVNLIGGGARSALWRRILASALPATIRHINIPPEDATTLGAAVLAGTGTGIFASLLDGIARMQIEHETRPQSDWQKTYDERYRLYIQLYPALEATFHASAK